MPAEKSPLTFLTESIPAFTVGTPYTTQFQAAGGTPPYSFGIFESEPPPGMTLDSNGTFSGTPTQPGDTTIMVRVIDFVEEKVTSAFNFQDMGRQ